MAETRRRFAPSLTAAARDGALIERAGRMAPLGPNQRIGGPKKKVRKIARRCRAKRKSKMGSYKWRRVSTRITVISPEASDERFGG
jgi:hypothetical protein